MIAGIRSDGLTFLSQPTQLCLRHLVCHCRGVLICQSHLTEESFIKSLMISCNSNFNNYNASDVLLIQLHRQNDGGVGMSSGKCGKNSISFYFILLSCQLGDAKWKTEGPELSTKLQSPSLQGVCNALKALPIIHD